MGKRATSTVEEEIFQVEGFDVQFVGDEAHEDRYVDPYPYERAANSSWTVKKWRSSRWEPTYPDFDVEVLDADGAPVHGKTLLSTVRETYETDAEPNGAPESLSDFTNGSSAAEPPVVTTGSRISPRAAIANDGGSSPTTDLSDVQRTLWAAADELRANSSLAANEYRGPVLGLIFLAYAEYRFDEFRPEIEAQATARHRVTADDYKAKSVLFIDDEARLSHLVQLTGRIGSTSPDPLNRPDPVTHETAQRDNGVTTE